MNEKNLVLIRHGQSEWNKQNLFTGWTDVDLSEKGVQEAKHAAQLLKNKSITFDLAFASALKRSIHTLEYILEEMNLSNCPITKTWRLNERHYGSLQGQNKQDIVNQYGKEQLQKWRRDYKTRPPLMEKAQIIENKMHYEDLKEVPLGESLQDTSKRVLPFWESHIFDHIKQGKSVLIAAHGNSLRALVKHLEKISDDDIASLEINTGEPLVYSIDEQECILNKEILKKDLV